MDFLFYLQAISGHYASSHCYYIDVRGTIQEHIETEVLGIARKKLGEDIDVSFAVCLFYFSGKLRSGCIGLMVSVLLSGSGFECWQGQCVLLGTLAQPCLVTQEY